MPPKRGGARVSQSPPTPTAAPKDDEVGSDVKGSDSPGKGAKRGAKAKQTGGAGGGAVSAGSKRGRKADEEQQSDDEGDRIATPLHFSPEGGKIGSKSKAPASTPGRPSAIVRNAVMQSLAARKQQGPNAAANGAVTMNGSPLVDVQGRPSARFATPKAAATAPRGSQKVVREPTPETDVLKPLRGTLSVVGAPHISSTKIELVPFMIGPSSHPTAGWKGAFPNITMNGIDGSGHARHVTALVSVLLPPSKVPFVTTEQHEAYDD